MKSSKSLSLSAIAAFTLGLTACGGGGGSTPPPTPPAAISVAFSAQPPTSLTTATTTSITALVSNDSKSAGVTWTVTCGSTACGSFSAAATASGVATVYTAPAAIPTNNTVIVTATSVSDTTKSQSATITITAAAPGISVAFNPAPPSSLAVSTTSPLTAVVTNDTKNAGVTWTVTCGSSGACGSFSATSTASGTATIYAAPAAIPTGGTVVVTATSVTDTTKFQSATITITKPGILADGNYVYHFSGYDSTGPSFFAGAFTVAGGVITGGEQDFTDAAGIDPGRALVASTSSLSTAGSNIQIVLGTANTNLGVNGLETLRGTVVSSSRVLISEYDTFGVATGSIDLQASPVAAPSGGYAFGISGWYITSTANDPLGIGGILNVSGTSVSTTNSVFDFNLAGNVGQSQLFSSGTVTTPDSFGRVTFSLVPTATSNVPSFVLTGYIVGPNQIQLVESQTDPLDADLGGTALGQGSNTGKFSQTTVANATYVFAASGVDINGGTTFAGGFAFNGAGGVTGSLAINDFAFFSGNTLSGGTYTVDPTGRVTISNVTATPANATFTFQLYLDGNGNALELGLDGQQVTFGPSYLQTSTTADFEGAYALVGDGILNNSPTYSDWGAVGPATISSDNVTGSTDYNAQGLTPTSAVSLTGTETSSTTSLSLIGLDGTSFTASRGYSYIPIDGKRVFAIEIDGAQLGLLTLETISH